MRSITIAFLIMLLPNFALAELSAEAKKRIAELKASASGGSVAISGAAATANGLPNSGAGMSTAGSSAASTVPVTMTPIVTMAKKKPVIDKVILKNGDVLSGKLVEMFNGVLLFKAYGNDIKLPWNEVVTLETVDGYRFTLSKGGALDGPIEASESGKFAIVTQVGTVTAMRDDVSSIDNHPAIARKKREKEEAARFSLSKVWAGTLSIGVSDTTGNSESRNTNLSVEATRKTQSDKLFLDGHFNRTKAAGVTSTDAVRGGMRLDVNITNDRFYFLFGRMEVDKIKDLDMRSIVGAGLGNVFYDNPRGHLDMGFGITYVRDTYENAPKDSDRTFLYSLNWDRQISRAFKFKERLLVYPNLADFADYRIEADTKFDYALGNSLSMTFGITNRYDAEPLPGKKEHDLTVTTAITKKY